MINGDLDLDGGTAVIPLLEALKEVILDFFELRSIYGDILYLLIFYLLDLDYIINVVHYFYWMIFWKRLK